MSNWPTIGAHSPNLEALANEIESEITSDTPPHSATSESSRRKLQFELEAELLKSELEDVPEEPQDLMSDKLERLKDYLGSDEAKKAFNDADLDVSDLLDSLKPKDQSDADYVQVTTPGPKGSHSSMNVLHASAIRQSNRLSVSREGKLHAEQSATGTEPPGTNVTTITIDGRKLQVSKSPTAEVDCTTRLFDKTTRKDLDAKDRQAFVRYATTWVLPKHNKLTLYTFGKEDSGTMRNIRNLQSQLKKLRRHFVSYDVVDVFSIVIPSEVDVSSQLVSPIQTFNLFTDYQRLHVTQVANSNAWFNMYCSDSYIKENMTYSYECLLNNTEDKLWEHCVIAYEKYSVVQRGGPLMLFLLLQEIQDSSETAITFLLKQFKELTISSVPGEDVNEVITTIRSTHETLVSVSTESHDYVPSDFCKTVLSILQTSSVPKFNEIFSDEENAIDRAANRHGGLPQWPDVEEIFQLATNTYRSMSRSPEWTTANKPASYNVQVPGSKSELPFYLRDWYKCFNCEKKCGQPLKSCPTPRDDARIERNRKAHNATRDPSKSKPRKGSPRSHLTSTKGKHKGRPMMLNKNGAYVLDVKRDRELKSVSSKEKEKDDVLSMVKQYFNQQPPPDSTATPPTTVEPSSGATVDSAVTFDHIKGLMLKLG